MDALPGIISPTNTFKIILVLIRFKLCACVATFAVFAEVGFNSLRMLFLVKTSHPSSKLLLCTMEQKHLIDFSKQKNKVQTAHYAEGTTDSNTS